MINKKISIIIPIYNTEKYLVQCVDSVINQTYKYIEIILVDDGSADNSPEICDEYAKKDNRIIVIHKDNGGVSSARNVGIDKSTGDFIMFLDSDDWIDLETCATVLKIALDNFSDVVMWSYVREFEIKSKKKRIFDEEFILFDKDEVESRLHRRMIGLLNEELTTPENADALVPVYVKMYKTSLIKNNKIQFIDLKQIGTSEDALFNLQVFGFVEKATYINRYFYHYRRDNTTSITTQYKPHLIGQWNCLFEQMSDYIKKNNLDSCYLQAWNNRICLSIIGLGLNELSNKEISIIKIKKIKEIISATQYRKSSKMVTLKYFPLHWKVFFLFAKMNFATGIFVLLVIIKQIRSR